MAKGKLIVIGGFAGAGKTTLTKKLAKYYQIPRIGIDSISRAIKDNLELKIAGIDRYSLAYPISYKLIEEFIDNNVPVIMDNNMCNPLSWKKLAEVKDKYRNLNIGIILLRCAYKVCARRIEYRRIKEPGMHEIGKHNIGEDKYVNKYKFIEERIKSKDKLITAVINTENRSKKEVFDEVCETIGGLLEVK